jgi:WS/DGAT/MGAT family acyltransferase
VKQIRSPLGGTVNDIMLTALTAGFRELLESRGDSIAGRTVTTMVPVSVRLPDARGDFDNRIAAFYPQLPVSLEDPLERLADIRRQMDGLKERHRAVGADRLATMRGFSAPEFMAQATRATAALGNASPVSLFETVTTNVPGPQHPLYVLGRQMIDMYGWMPLSAPIRIAIAITSYNGFVNISIVGDYDGGRDLGVVARGTEHGLAALCELAAIGGGDR